MVNVIGCPKRRKSMTRTGVVLVNEWVGCPVHCPLIAGHCVGLSNTPRFPKPTLSSTVRKWKSRSSHYYPQFSRSNFIFFYVYLCGKGAFPKHCIVEFKRSPVVVDTYLKDLGIWSVHSTSCKGLNEKCSEFFIIPLVIVQYKWQEL